MVEESIVLDGWPAKNLAIRLYSAPILNHNKLHKIIGPLAPIGPLGSIGPFGPHRARWGPNWLVEAQHSKVGAAALANQAGRPTDQPGWPPKKKICFLR